MWKAYWSIWERKSTKCSCVSNAKTRDASSLLQVMQWRDIWLIRTISSCKRRYSMSMLSTMISQLKSKRNWSIKRHWNTEKIWLRRKFSSSRIRKMVMLKKMVKNGRVMLKMKEKKVIRKVITNKKPFQKSTKKMRWISKKKLNHNQRSKRKQLKVIGKMRPMKKKEKMDQKLKRNTRNIKSSESRSPKQPSTKEGSWNYQTAKHLVTDHSSTFTTNIIDPLAIIHLVCDLSWEKLHSNKDNSCLLPTISKS